MKSKARKQIRQSASGPVVRVLAVGIMVSGALGVYVSGLGYPHPTSLYPTQTLDELLRFIGIVLLALELLLAYSLNHIQQGIYWFSWLQFKKNPLDENQKDIRRRVFERAYPYSLIISLAAVSSLTSMSSYDPAVRNSLTVRIIFAVGVALIALPSILAAIRKDG